MTEINSLLKPSSSLWHIFTTHLKKQIPASHFILAIFLMVVIFSLYFGIISIVYHISYYTDFNTLYHSVSQYWEHESAYNRVVSSFVNIPITRSAELTQYLGLNLNSPAFNLFFLVFTLFSVKTAYLLWQTASLISYLIVMTLLYLEFEKQYSWRISLPLFLLMGLLYHPVFTTFSTSQVALQLLLPLTVAWIAERREKTILAGAILGALFAVKIFFGLFLLYFLFLRQWKGLTTFLVTWIILNLLSAAVFGLSVFHEYSQALDQIGWYMMGGNYSLMGSLSRFFGGFQTNGYFEKLHPPLHYPLLSRWLYYGISGLILCGSLWIARMPLKSSFKKDWLFAYFLIAIILISPFGWVYYFVFCLIPMLLIYHERSSTFLGKCAYLLMVFSIFLPGSPWFLKLIKTDVSPLVLAIIEGTGTYALLFLLTAVLINSFTISAPISTPPLRWQNSLVIIALIVSVSISSILFTYTFVSALKPFATYTLPTQQQIPLKGQGPHSIIEFH